MRLEGRLDRDGAEHLSGRLEKLVQAGVRSLTIDLARVTYVSSAATHVLARWHQELAMLRGEVHVTAIPTGVQEAFTVMGWEPGLQGADPLPGDLRRSSWHAREDFAASGLYELSAILPAGRLTCRLHGNPARLAQAPYRRGDCDTVSFPEGAFGLGLGAIGTTYEECHTRLGELIAAGGCIAYFPTDGARVADYLVGGGRGGAGPRAVLVSGCSCEGGFSQLIRFSPRPDAGAIPFSELAGIGLDAVGGETAGMVIVAEAAGLSGVRLRRSPTDPVSPLRFSVPAVRDWLLLAPEPIHRMTTTVIAGVVTRTPEGPLAAHLRPLEGVGRLFGHFHAAVFAYHPLPQRTVDLAPLLRGLFANQQLRDVLHLIRDNRSDVRVNESEFLRGVAWAGPVSRFC